MAARRVLLVGTQQADLVRDIAGDLAGEAITLVVADPRDPGARLGGRASFDAIVIDGARGEAATLAALRAAGRAGDASPAIVLVPAGGEGLARAALAAGAACVERGADGARALRWALFAAFERARRDRVSRGRAPLADHLRAILHHLHEGVLIVEARGRTIAGANPAAERLFGTPFAPGEPLAARPAYRLRDRAGRALATGAAPIERVLADGEARFDERLLIERPDGRQTAVAVSAVPLRDADDALYGALGIFQELTDQAHAQLVRDEVLSIASHELRTPLTVILGYSSLLRTLPQIRDETRIARAVNKIYDQSLRMRDLIEYLLDFSQLTLGRLQLQWVAFDLGELVGEVGARQQAEAGPRPIRLALPGEPLAMSGDYGRLTQALTQVVRAARQGAQAELTIALRATTPTALRAAGATLPESEAARYALIAIGPPELGQAGGVLAGSATPLDDGPGMLAPEQALELTVSAELVRLHGGALLIDHRPNLGDAFSVILPLQDAAR